ncbi:DHA2 family efflux MFS transporter permease subunit [Demequina lutea]|uniref:EmrB/QacA subfamily drug resistance transporter n=1 Tax=Demequina lutea TaxID=431489 RepID=A0A7Z0CK27_9MICO|nr:DHA2 family efflux MFS transporter permease subunit [Demequina lutea]NYI41295.1 EmrB/QacA subfamily drug resistance transporter [Demequina lutea]
MTTHVGALPARYRHRFLILAICCMSLLIVTMDTMAVNVALPSIRAEFGSSVSALQWTVDAYTLVLACLLILSGSTADRIGRRTTFQLGLVVFTVGSLLCSFATTTEWLITFRAVQAIGGSMLNPVAMSIITHTFDDPAPRARAVGAWSAVSGISMAIGPIVGGLLTDTVGWRGIFWINVPIGVAAILLTALFVPESRSRHRRRVDLVGQGLIMAMLGCLIAGLIEGPHLGWGNPVTIALFTTSATAIAAFIPYELRRPEPLIDVRFFRSISFSAALATAIAGFAAYSGFIFLMTLYLQEVRHFTPFEAGLKLLPMAIGQLICSNISGHLVGARGTRTPLLISASAVLVATLVLALWLAPSSSDLLLLTVFLLYGIGQGFLNAPVTTMSVSGMPRSQSGSAAATTSTARQVGTSLGVALAGALTGLGASTAVGTAYVGAARSYWWLVVGLALLIGALAWLSTSGPAHRSRAGISHLFPDDPPTALAPAA